MHSKLLPFKSQDNKQIFNFAYYLVKDFVPGYITDQRPESRKVT
jgi:hypothetical protein